MKMVGKSLGMVSVLTGRMGICREKRPQRLWKNEER